MIQVSIFFVVPTGFMIALDLQQKLKTLLHSSQQQMAMRSFLRIDNSFVKFRISSLNFLDF